MKFKTIDFIGTLILFVGAIFAFLPHAYHSKIALEGESHFVHVVIGIALIIIGLVILVAGQKIYNKK